MGKAAICVPYDYTVTSSSAAAAGSDVQFIRNDEPGLVYRTSLTSGTVSIVIDLGVAKPVQFLSLLGLVPGEYPVNVAASQSASMASPVHQGSLISHFSTKRTADDAKFLYTLPVPIAARYWSVQFVTGAGFDPKTLNIWRLLIGYMIQPGENIAIGAEEGIDDRSVRRYARNGRRTIDPTVIVPTFQGSWEWLEPNEFDAIKTWWRQRGATKPSLLVLDTEMGTLNPHGGEDGMLYGDFEKSAKLTYNEGCYSFSFAVVAIAP